MKEGWVARGMRPVASEMAGGPMFACCRCRCRWAGRRVSCLGEVQSVVVQVGAEMDAGYESCSWCQLATDCVKEFIG